MNLPHRTHARKHGNYTRYNYVPQTQHRSNHHAAVRPKRPKYRGRVGRIADRPYTTTTRRTIASSPQQGGVALGTNAMGQTHMLFNQNQRNGKNHPFRNGTSWWIESSPTTPTLIETTVLYQLAKQHIASAGEDNFPLTTRSNRRDIFRETS